LQFHLGGRQARMRYRRFFIRLINTCSIRIRVRLDRRRQTAM
jgi:hypothetical protein